MNQSNRMMTFSETETGLLMEPGIKEKKINLLYLGRSEETMNYFRGCTEVVLTIRNTFFSAVNYLVSGNRPDVIFCDCRLSGARELEMYHFVRQHPELRRTVFILISPKFREDLFKAAREHKVDDYFVSPLPDPLDLLSRVRFLLNYRSKMQPEAQEELPMEGIRMPLSKRVFDIFVASTALIVLAPLLILVMIAIRLESKGKVYYTSRRVGQKPFDFYKFRSMRTGSDAELERLAREKNQYSSGQGMGEVDYETPCQLCTAPSETGICSHALYIGRKEICEPWYHHQKAVIAQSTSSFIKIKDDPRITRVGKIIRNLSIDELPQLINVIKGDMSLVGNRPLPVYEAEKLTIDRAARRFLSPAGLTGLWQVELRGKKGKMSEEERKRLDNKYASMFIRNKYSIWYDLKLILRTIPALFQKETV